MESVKNSASLYNFSAELKPRGLWTPDFKWQGWSNGGKNQNPKKSLDQNLSPKKSHAEFPSHNKNFQEA